MPEADDWELLRRSRGSEPRAFAELVERHYVRAVAFCAQYVGDHAKAEDLVQQAFDNVYRGRDRFEPRASFKTFFYRILVNLSLSEIRKRSGTLAWSVAFEEPTGIGLMDTRAEDPTARVEEVEAESMLERALLLLRPEHRMALYLREHEGLAYQEIAEALGATLAEVKVWIHRARWKLLESLKPYLEDGEALP